MNNSGVQNTLSGGLAPTTTKKPPRHLRHRAKVKHHRRPSSREKPRRSKSPSPPQRIPHRLESPPLLLRLLSLFLLDTPRPWSPPIEAVGCCRTRYSRLPRRSNRWEWWHSNSRQQVRPPIEASSRRRIRRRRRCYARAEKGVAGEGSCFSSVEIKVTHRVKHGSTLASTTGDYNILMCDRRLN